MLVHFSPKAVTTSLLVSHLLHWVEGWSLVALLITLPARRPSLGTCPPLSSEQAETLKAPMA